MGPSGNTSCDDAFLLVKVDRVAAARQLPGAFDHQPTMLLRHFDMPLQPGRAC